MSILDALKLLAADIGPITVGEEEIGPNIAADGSAIDSVLSQVFILIGSIAVIFVIVGALRYVLANGDSSAIQKAKNTILYAIVGVVVAAMAFAIVQFVSTGVSSGL